MNSKTKKALKIGGIAASTVVGVTILAAAFVGGGTICCELYYDPKNWMHSVFQSSILGYDHVFGLGWAA